MATTAQERMSFAAPRGIITLIVAALLGGGAGAASSALGARETSAAPTIVGLTKPEVQQVAAEAEGRAKAHADTAVTVARDDGRRDLSATQTTLSATLNRLEGKVDQLGETMGDLKADVAALKARRR